MQLKPTVKIILDHKQLALIHSALAELPFKQVAGMFQHLDVQLRSPENLAEDGPSVEDDRGAGGALTGTDAS